MEKSIRKQYIAKLKEVITENARKSVLLRIDAQFEKGMDRHRLHIQKRHIGYDTRRYLLAYAFLRNVPYKICEPRTHDAIESHSIEYAVKSLGIELDRNDLRGWMAGVVMEKEVA